MSDLDTIWSDILDWQKTISAKDEQLSRQKPIRNQKWPPVRKPAEITVNDSLKPVGLAALRILTTPSHEKNEKKHPADAPPPTATTTKKQDKGKQPAVPLPRQKPAERALAEKDNGNACFQKQDYRQAIVHYGRAVELDPSQAVYFINRAMAYLKLQMYLEAEQDCTRGLALQPTNVKALWRRGMARRSLGRVSEARQDFEKGLEIDPNNKPIKDELNKLPKPASTPTSVTKTTTAPKKQQERTGVDRKRLPIKVVDAAYPKSTSPVSEATPVSKQLPPASPQKPATVATTATPTTSSTAAATATSSAQPQKTTPAKTTAPSAPSKPPFALPPIKFNIPKTTLEFERDWKACRHRGPDVLYQYFQSIPLSAYGTLFRSSLESDQFEQMIDLLESHYTKEKSNQDIYNVLHGLTQVRRIDMLVMFMGNKQKKALERLFGQMKGSVDGSALGKLAKVYGVKM